LAHTASAAEAAAVLFHLQQMAVSSAVANPHPTPAAYPAGLPSLASVASSVLEAAVELVATMGEATLSQGVAKARDLGYPLPSHIARDAREVDAASALLRHPGEAMKVLARLRSWASGAGLCEAGGRWLTEAEAICRYGGGQAKHLVGAGDTLTSYGDDEVHFSCGTNDSGINSTVSSLSYGGNSDEDAKEAKEVAEAVAEAQAEARSKATAAGSAAKCAAVVAAAGAVTAAGVAATGKARADDGAVAIVAAATAETAVEVGSDESSGGGFGGVGQPMAECGGPSTPIGGVTITFEKVLEQEGARDSDASSVGDDDGDELSDGGGSILCEEAHRLVVAASLERARIKHYGF